MFDVAEDRDAVYFHPFHDGHLDAEGVGDDPRTVSKLASSQRWQLSTMFKGSRPSDVKVLCPHQTGEMLVGTSR